MTSPLTRGQAHVVKGDPLGKYEVTSEQRTIGKLLSPLGLADVPIIRCVGASRRFAHGLTVQGSTMASMSPRARS